MDRDDTVTTIGLRVSACAIGQASAAIFARSAIGRTDSDLQRALGSVESWLAGSNRIPQWPDLDLLGKAKDYPGRHEAILLPWRAAISALSKG